jgi:serine/threonine protein kinase
MKQRFERKARAISALNHPHICTLHDLGNQDGTDYLVMEFLEGESLAERSKKGPLPLKETLKIAIELCEALEAAHKAGIIHRGDACYWWGATVFIFGCGKRIW